jgi:hypothetical protein
MVVGTAEGLRHPMADDPAASVFDPARIKTLDDSSGSSAARSVLRYRATHGGLR